jgi:hypothetical protein
MAEAKVKAAMSIAAERQRERALLERKDMMTKASER